MGRQCPDCGELLQVSLEHVKVLADRPVIASARWDCASCGWSLALKPAAPAA